MPNFPLTDDRFSRRERNQPGPESQLVLQQSRRVFPFASASAISPRASSNPSRRAVLISVTSTIWKPRCERNGLLLWPAASFSTSAKNSGGIRAEEKKPRSPPRDFVASSSDASAASWARLSPRARRTASASIAFSLGFDNFRRRIGWGGEKQVRGAEPDRLRKKRAMRLVKIPALLVGRRCLSGDLLLQPLERTKLIRDSLAQGLR